ncbi:TolC family protein [Chryseolinea sp. H1M3-3]|uniref:TolC family protein n=1 Tax=Chryseolinea sp. H1M3-3 TaxID=3034144 RepID=UPI0023EC9A59|nr:TolC family protein [Chryseolinea sp. H1M3-3]
MKSISKYILLALAFGAFTPNVKAQQKLSLQEAVNLAVDQNPEILARDLEIEKSRQQKIVSRSLFLPSVNLSAQANHYFRLNPFFGFGESAADGKIPYGRFGGEDQVGAFLSAVQPLYNPQAFPAVQHSRIKEEESRLALSSTKIETQAAVKQVYLQILVLNERIKLQHESIKRNQRALQDAKSLFLQGKGLRVDTLRAYTAVKNLEPDLLKLTSAVETSKLQMKALIGIDSLQDIQLTDSLFLPDAGSIPSEDTVYAVAKNNNPLYRAIELQKELNSQEIKIASSARMPVVNAVAQYQIQSQTNNFEYNNAYYPSSSFVGLQISVPLFTGLSNQAKVRQARISKDQTHLRSQYEYEQLRSKVHEVVSNSHESLARLQTTVDVRETAQLSYNIIQYRYKRGVASRLELTDAEYELSAAQSNYLEAVYDYLSARIELQRIMGE